MRFFYSSIFFIALLTAAQSRQVIDSYTTQGLAKTGHELAVGDRAFASRELQKYGNHYTMVAFRSTTGSSEIHDHEADIFVIEEGEAQLLTGGKMLGRHLQKPGEWRGTSIEGGEKREVKVGDIIHIPAGVPHQLLVTKGKPLTYFVVKVKDQ